MEKIKKGDEVIVIAGKDKGKKGTVSAVQVDGRLLVDGVNVAKKHVKANPMAGVQGGIISKEMPIDRSNVMVFNPNTNKGEKVGIKEEDGKKVRFFKSSGEIIG